MNLCPMKSSKQPILPRSMFSRSVLLVCSIILCSCSKQEEPIHPAATQAVPVTQLLDAPDIIKLGPHSAPASSFDQNALVNTEKAVPPPILVAFLSRYPAYHLLSPSDLPEDSAKVLNSHELEPFVVADTNQDGNDDVAAIIVRGQKFYALVLQTVEPRVSATPRWLLRDMTEPILGIVVKNGYITPAFCSGCDTNYWFGWTGSEYAMQAILKDGRACLTDVTDIFSLPNERSKLVYTTTKFELATVLAIGLRSDGYYWYEVKLDNGATGYVLNSAFSFEPGTC